MSSFKPIKLNDGRSIPSIGYGTWRIGNGETVVQQVDQALSTGFDHIDTAQIYRNEDETGDALALSGIPRNELWITSKYSGADPALDIYESCKASLSKVSYLFVLHRTVTIFGLRRPSNTLFIVAQIEEPRFIPHSPSTAL